MAISSMAIYLYQHSVSWPDPILHGTHCATSEAVEVSWGTLICSAEDRDLAMRLHNSAPYLCHLLHIEIKLIDQPVN